MGTKSKKEVLAHAILANPTYMPESGLYKHLFSRLLSLSRIDLGNLKLILDLKHNRAGEEEK